jgi:chorismate mutase
MSPQNKTRLKNLRKQIDRLDDNLIKIFKKRTVVVKEVIRIKEYKNQIVDKKRINKILSDIKKKSLNNNIDPKITNRIWKNIIWAYIDFEKKNFKKK